MDVVNIWWHVLFGIMVRVWWVEYVWGNGACLMVCVGGIVTWWMVRCICGGMWR